MAHFAKIEDGIVTQVVVVDDEHEASGEAYLKSLGLDGKWIQTSYNANIRKHFSGIGYAYSESLDAFIPPQPYESWLLNEETCTWSAPVEKPTDNRCAWDEQSLSWINI
jgi:hypothetical protein